MSVSQSVLPADAQPAGGGGPAVRAPQAAHLLEQGFGVEFNLFDGESGDLVHASPGQPDLDWQLRAELLREVARRGRPELVADEPPFAVLALPLAAGDEHVAVAAAVFATRLVTPGENISEAARVLGMEPEKALDWASRQTPWAPESLERVSGLVMEQAAAGTRIKQLEEENDQLKKLLGEKDLEISILRDVLKKKNPHLLKRLK